MHMIEIYWSNGYRSLVLSHTSSEFIVRLKGRGVS
jgi:hypothetical protein